MYFLLTKGGFLVYNGCKLKYQRKKVCKILYGTAFGRLFRTKLKSSSGDGQKGGIPRKIIEKRIKGCYFVGK